MSTASKIRAVISYAVFADLQVRGMVDAGSWRSITGPGTYYMSPQQAREIADDCDYQGNITGNWIDPVSGGVTRAYRALYANITKALETATVNAALEASSNS